MEDHATTANWPIASQECLAVMAAIEGGMTAKEAFQLVREGKQIMQRKKETPVDYSHTVWDGEY